MFFVDRPIPKALIDKYKIVEKHFEKCKIENFNYSNYGEWIDNLFEVGHRFAIRTIEYILATSYTNKALWKSYILGLKDRDTKVSLIGGGGWITRSDQSQQFMATFDVD